LGYESVDRTTFENIPRSTLSYPNETSKECIQFLNISIYVTPVFIFGCSKLPVVVTMVYVFKLACYFESVFQYPLKFIEYYTL
jgi:hypothetical protein